MVMPTPVIKLAQTPALVTPRQNNPSTNGPRKDPASAPHDQDIKEVIGLLGNTASTTDSTRNTATKIRISSTCIRFDIFLKKLPFKKAGVNCIVVPDVTPYKKRKVRILNGAHTGFVLGAYLGGFDIVRDCMADDAVRGFMNQMLYEEIIPTLPLDKKDLMEFAGAVQDRFNNPFVDHELMSISLNSTSKWRARNLPSLLDYIGLEGKIPSCLAMSFAAYTAFYTNDIQELNDKGLVCRRAKGNTYVCSDDRWVLEFYWDHKDDSAEDLVHAVMTDEQMWGQDLTQIEGFEKLTVDNLKLIREKGALAAFASCL